jgi:hypothetical protein
MANALTVRVWRGKREGAFSRYEVPRLAYLELLRRDNLPRANRIAELLGRAPRAVCARPAEVATPAVTARALR